MPDQKLLDYIRIEQEKGIDRALIFAYLLNAGWQQAQIDEALASLGNPPAQPTDIQPVQQNPSQNPQAVNQPQPGQNNSLASNQNYLPSFKELLKQSWQIYKDRWKTLVAISLTPLLLLIIGLPFALLSPVFVLVLGQGFMFISIALMGISALLALLFYTWSPVALLYALKDRNEKIGFKASFGRSRNRVFSYFILSLIFLLLTWLGFVFFFVPGLIFVTWFSFASYVFVEENTGPLESLRKSKQYVSGKLLAVYYRLLALGLFIGFVSLILALIPIVNIFSAFITFLVLFPLVTIYNLVLYENLKNLNGKPISNPPSKLFVFLIMFVFGLIMLCSLVFVAYFVPNLVKNLGKKPTTYQYNQNYNSNNLTTPTPSPAASTSGGFNQIQQAPSMTPALTPACTIDWSNFPPSIVNGGIYTFSVTFNSNFGTAMPSVYIYPDGQSLYRDSNSSGSGLNSVTVNISLTGPASGTYTLKPYLDDSSGKGIECNEKVFTVGGQNLPSPTP